MTDLPKIMDKIEKAEEQQTHPLVQALKIATYPLAAMTAFIVGRTEIRKAIYKNFVSAGGLKDLQVYHRQEVADLMRKGETMPVTNGPALTQASNNAYRMAVKERFEKIGFHGVTDYWHGLHPNQKTNAIVFAAGAAGIVITTSLAFVNNRSMLHKLTARGQEADTPEQPAL